MQVGPEKFAFFSIHFNPPPTPSLAARDLQSFEHKCECTDNFGWTFFERPRAIKSWRGRGVIILKVLGKNTIFLTPYGWIWRCYILNVWCNYIFICNQQICICNTNPSSEIYVHIYLTTLISGRVTSLWTLSSLSGRLVCWCIILSLEQWYHVARMKSRKHGNTKSCWKCCLHMLRDLVVEYVRVWRECGKGVGNNDPPASI